MKASEFRKLIREEIHKVLNEVEGEGELTYTFQLYGVKVEELPPRSDVNFKGGYVLTKGATKATILAQRTKQFPDKVVLQPKGGARGYPYPSIQLSVRATPETFTQVVNNSINAGTKEFSTEGEGIKVKVQIEPRELERIRDMVIKAFETRPSNLKSL
jgi:hypothetical protein